MNTFKIVNAQSNTCHQSIWKCKIIYDVMTPISKQTSCLILKIKISEVKPITTRKNKK